MTLLFSTLAAVVSTMVWYTSEKARTLKVGMLCSMFWGASLMWMVDAIAEYAQMGAAYFTPAAEDMINDAFLGVCVIALALLIWLGRLLLADPLGVIRGKHA